MHIIRVRPQREKLTVRPRRLKNAYGRMCTCTCTCARACAYAVTVAGRPAYSGHGRRGLYYRPCGSLCSIKPYGSLGRTASVPRFCTDPRAEPVARTERALQKPVELTHARSPSRSRKNIVSNNTFCSLFELAERSVGGRG